MIPRDAREFQRLFFGYKPFSLPDLAIAFLRTTRLRGVSDRSSHPSVRFFAFLSVELYSVISEGRPRQSSQLTATSNKRWGFWKFGVTSTPRFPPGKGLFHDAESEKDGQSMDPRNRSNATPNFMRRSDGWFSKFKSLFKRNRCEWL